MEPKCDYCGFFNEKPHCNNCKLFNKTRARIPQEMDCTLEELVAFMNGTEDIAERFAIGDYKNIELYTGEVAKMILLGVEHDSLVGGGLARATFGILGLDEYYQMNPQNTNEGGYVQSAMNRIYIERIFKLLPEVLRNNIKPIYKKTSAGRGSSQIITSEHKLWLFSEVEILGTPQYSFTGEGEQYDFFTQARNRTFRDWIFTRSPCKGSSYYFCVINSDGGATYLSANYHCAVPFGFCL